MSSPADVVDDDKEEQQIISEDFLCSLLIEREVVPPNDPPPPNHFESMQKQRRHPSDRRLARRKPDWPTCLARSVSNSNRRAFADEDGDDDEPNDVGEATHSDDESPTTAPRRRDGGADRGVGTTSWRRREFSSTTVLASSAMTTKNAKTIALAVLAASALALAEYGAARSSSSAVADIATVSTAGSSTSGRNNYDDANYHHRPAVVIGGHQARSQVPIPVEYSNFVELAEFADAVAALRAHRDGRTRERAMDDRQRQQQQREEQTRPHSHGIDSEHNIDDADLGNTTEHNDNEEGDDRGGGQVEDELKEMNNAIEKSWKGAIERTNPEMDQQLQPPLDPAEVHVPFYWHVPRAGGATLSALIGACHSLVQASSSLTSPPLLARDKDEALASRFRDPELYVLRAGGMPFANVDLDGIDGVSRAWGGGLIEAGLVDVVAVPDARLGSLLFDSRVRDGGDDDGRGYRRGPPPEQRPPQPARPREYRGVMFALFRHPIDRAVSLFYCKKLDKGSIHYDPTLETSYLEDWIVSPSYIPDYMVRTLVGKILPPAPLGQVDLDVAKEILRRKFVVGLLEEKGESMKRFEKFFGWDAGASRHYFDATELHAAPGAPRWKNAKDEECRDRLLYWGWINKNKHPTVEEGSGVYRLLETQNRYDIELFMYARQLFEEQFMQLGFDEDLKHSGWKGF